MPPAPLHSHRSYLSAASVAALWLAVALCLLSDAICTHQRWRIGCAGIGLLVPATLLVLIARRWQQLPK